MVITPGVGIGFDTAVPREFGVCRCNRLRRRGGPKTTRQDSNHSSARSGLDQDVGLASGPTELDSVPEVPSHRCRVWRDFKVTAEYSVRLSVSVFNLLNHVNPLATR